MDKIQNPTQTNTGHEAHKLDAFIFICAFFGTAYIAVPSAQLGNIPAYAVGSPMVGLGIILMTFTSIRNKTLPAYISVSFLITILLILLTPVFPILYYPIASLNLALGVSFLLLGQHLLTLYKANK